MQKLLVRKSGNSRIFPDIDAGLYRACALDKAAVGDGRKLLSLSNVKLTWWQRHLGWRLSPSDRFGRLLLLHRLAFEAELNGQLRRADFFWHEALAHLRRIWTHDDVWKAVRGIVSDDAAATPQALRVLVATELFIDTHIAFANGRLAQASRLYANDRLFAHVAFIRSLLKLHQLPAEDAAFLLAPAIEAEIGSFESESRWDNAISRLGEYIALCPGDLLLRERLATLYFRRSLARLSNTDGMELANASRLGEAIGPLERMRHESPECTLVYDLLGQLHHLQSIQLGNGRRLADALVAARKAQILAPSLAGVDSTLAQLAAAMTNLQKEMGEVDRKLRAGGVTLNEDGKRLQREARTGFSLLEQYDKSEEPLRLANQRRLAQSRKLWRDVGLPSEAGSEEKVTALLDVVSQVYASEATTAEDLADGFHKAALDKPGISDISADLVAKFILARREENSGKEAAVAPDQPEAAATFSISVPEEPARRNWEPLWYWLLGRQDPAARILAAAAGLAAIAVAGATAADAQGSRTRSDAYPAMVAAVRADDEKGIVAEAGRFLGAWTLRTNDPREALVRAAERDAVEAPNNRIRNAAVAAMQAALDRGDHAAAIEAAERFVGAPTLRGVDPRQEAVLDLYAREFVAWFADLRVPFGEAAQAHIDKYKRLTSVSPAAARKP